jgi:hypothetical protein
MEEGCRPTIEGYFSILKRGVNGVYHHVGKQHSYRYLSEFDFRYNSRLVEDGERFTGNPKGDWQASYLPGLTRLMLRESNN